jgi:hypothetical protein
MRHLLFTALFLLAAHSVPAQSFSDYFENKTLRVDYQFSGDYDKQEIYIDELCSLPGWAGRRNHLSELPLEGNGQITMRDKKSGDVIYRTSFSSLMQEWVSTDDAKGLKKAFENVFLLPFPKAEAEVEVTLFTTKREVMATMKHTVSPTDILIHAKGTERITPHKYLLKSGDEADKIDIAILAEGYTQEEMDKFYEDADSTMQSLFYYEPFKSMKERFNIVAVASPSRDSGVSVPRKGDWKQTAFNSHFDSFYSDRYLTIDRVKSIHDALAGIPYEHIIILANTPIYGGGGIYNSYLLVAAHHRLTRPVVVHEFGHSFGGLTDEYFYENDMMSDYYPTDIEPWEQNVTTLVDFDSKWKDMLKKNTPVPTPKETSAKYPVGVYEGGGYSAKGVYRPAYDCRMRTNECPDFCPVCQRAITRVIDFYTK